MHKKRNLISIFMVACFLQGCGGNGSSGGSVAPPPREETDYIAFAATDLGNSGNYELWRTDGTPEGTRIIREINESGGSSPSDIIQSGRRTYFSADDGVHGREVWFSRGEADNTVMLGDVWPGRNGDVPIYITPLDDLVFFNHADGLHGRELWVGGETAQSARMLRDIAPGPCESWPQSMHGHDSELFFWAREGCGANSLSLWRSDGTDDGTYRLEDFDFTGMSVFMAYAWQDHLYWVTSSGDDEYSLWQSDGTPQGTRLLLGGEGSGIRMIQIFSGSETRLFFTAATAEEGEEPWRYDRTTDDVVMLADIREGPAGSVPTHFISLGEVTYFFARLTGGNQPEVWRTDGSPEGTWKVLDATLFWREMMPFGDRLVLTAVSSVGGHLWVSDGTAESTTPIAPEAGLSSPRMLGEVYGKFVFAAHHPEYGREIWRTDGTAEGTILLQDICPGVCSGLPE